MPTRLILVVNAIEAMCEDLPSLSVRASALARRGGHIYHTLIRMIEVWLLRFQSSPRIFHHWTVGQSSIEGSSGKNADRIASTRKRQISEDGGSTSERSAFEKSPPYAGRRRLEGKKLIISVHIPKTGGTAFLEILKIIAQEVLYLDYGTQVFARTAVYRRGERVEEPFESVTDFESLPGRSVIHGHFRIRKYLKRFPQACYITWLRDPVDRLASHYSFWQRSAHQRGFMADPLCNRVISENMSLMEFTELDEVRNRQYEFLQPVGPKYCDFIGITEEYDRSIRLFQKLFCPEIDITPQLQKIGLSPQLQNKNPDRLTGRYDLDCGVRERILELNDLDVKTYVEGVQRFRMLCDQVGI